jgi:hypothetical protein
MPEAPAYTVVCLCAAWCGACRDYRRAFDGHAAGAPAVRHAWIDIEDEAGWLGDVDLDTLPTLLVLQGTTPMFFGAVLPHADVIERTLRALRAHGPAPTPVPASLADAVARIAQRVAAP